MQLPPWFIYKVAIPTLALKERLQTGVVFNPLDPRTKEDPYPYYAWLRVKDPVHRSAIMRGWVLSRHADVFAVLRDQRFGVEPEHAGAPAPPPEIAEGAFYRLFRHSLLSLDPPDHTRLRALARKAFTRGAVERMRPRIAAIVDELLAEPLRRGEMDIISDFAFPLPVIVIAEMLGVPPEDRAQFKAWSDDLGEGLEPLLTPEQVQRADRAARELSAYLRAIIGERRRHPREDLLSALVLAEEEGDRLNEQELFSMCALLLAAGNETTTNLIGNGMLALLRNPDQLQLLKERPELIESAVEELLRYDSPVQMTSRLATEDVEIGGKRIRRGQAIITLLGAANRDPAVFPHPNRLDITRTPGPHLAFGLGVHYCLGAPLARLEGAIAINALVSRTRGLRLAGEPRWRETLVLRGLRTLPVAFSADGERSMAEAAAAASVV
jgi:cytochrome P450